MGRDYHPLDTNQDVIQYIETQLGITGIQDIKYYESSDGRPSWTDFKTSTRKLDSKAILFLDPSVDINALVLYNGVLVKDASGYYGKPAISIPGNLPGWLKLSPAPSAPPALPLFEEPEYPDHLLQATASDDPAIDLYGKATKVTAPFEDEFGSLTPPAVLPDKPFGGGPLTPSAVLSAKPFGGGPHTPSAALPDKPFGGGPLTPSAVLSGKPFGGGLHTPSAVLSGKPFGGGPHTPSAALSDKPFGGGPLTPYSDDDQDASYPRHTSETWPVIETMKKTPTAEEVERDFNISSDDIASIKWDKRKPQELGIKFIDASLKFVYAEQFGGREAKVIGIRGDRKHPWLFIPDTVKLQEYITESMKGLIAKILKLPHPRLIKKIERTGSIFTVELVSHALKTAIISQAPEGSIVNPNPKTTIIGLENSVELAQYKVPDSEKLPAPPSGIEAAVKHQRPDAEIVITYTIGKKTSDKKGVFSLFSTKFEPVVETFVGYARGTYQILNQAACDELVADYSDTLRKGA
jgi:hypothetical protein